MDLSDLRPKRVCVPSVIWAPADSLLILCPQSGNTVLLIIGLRRFRRPHVATAVAHALEYPTIATVARLERPVVVAAEDRKSTRLNSSHVAISYAVFCLKKKTFKVGI